MSLFSALLDSEFAAAVTRLLPRGRAWTRATGSNLQAFVAAIGDCLFILQTAAVLLVETEQFPQTAVALLPDYEQDYGLPDCCTPAAPSIAARQSAVLGKIAASPGGQSEAYFIALAAAMGFPITITTWTPFRVGMTRLGGQMPPTSWRFAWRVNTAITASLLQLGTALGQPFWTISNPELECRLRQLQPAYGVLWFQYAIEG